MKTLPIVIATLFVTCTSLRAADPAPLPPTVAEGAKLEVVHDESQGRKRFFEGPAYDPRSGALYFTAFEKDSTQVMKIDAEGKVSVFLDASGGINGTFLSRKGDLLGCQGDKKRVVRIPLEGGPPEPRPAAEGFEGKPFTKPNDLVEDARGGIYFTDPDFAEKKASAVYYLTPDGKVRKVISDMKVPNGIGLQKGGRALYVSDSEEKHVRVFPVNPVTGEVNARAGKVFLDPATENRADPDGMTLDERGNLYATGRGGIWVAAPDGKVLGSIPIPEFASNCAFGGKDGRTLFITCQSRVYRLAMNVRGWESASRHADLDASLRFRQVSLDRAFHSEGAAIADVNRDGRMDVLAGDVWYEAPSWTMREVREAGKFDGTKGYSQSFGCFADDFNGDGWPDLLVIPFPGDVCRWYENPQGKPGRWKEHEVWHSACNETPLYADLLGNGKKVLVMGWQPAGKESEGTMAWFTPPAGGKGKWEMHPVSAPKAPGTHRFSHGLGVGDVNGDGRRDIIITSGWWEQPAEPATSPWPFREAPLGPDCADMHVDDVNKDGVPDVITSSAHDYGIWWHEQSRGADGKSSWKRHLIDDSFSQTHALHLVDLDGDGSKDLVTGKRWMAHQGGDAGEFEPVVLYSIAVERGARPVFTPRLIDLGVGIGTQFTVGDVNGDKLLDVVVGNKRGVHVVEQAARGSSAAK